MLIAATPVGARIALFLERLFLRNFRKVDFPVLPFL